MTKEALIAAGFTEEQATKIMGLHKQAIDGHYIPKDKFEAERENVKTLTTQLSERDSQITELGKFKGTAEELQGKVTDLEAKNKAAKEEYDSAVLTLQRNTAIKMEIQGKVIDPDDVIPKLDDSKIVLKDGKIESGLTEQLEALKKEKPHYFKEETNDGNKNLPKGWDLFGKTPPEGDDTKKKQVDEASEFGINLAKNIASGKAVADKAAEHYFK